jgi:hypothetical protein
MKKIDEYYILAGLIWLLAAMAYGVWLGAANHLNFSNSHAHAALVGFVVSTLFGMTYRFFPAMKTSRIAALQFIVYEIGAVLLVLGKVKVDAGGGAQLVAFGSVIVLIGVLMMTWIFATSRAPSVNV